MGGETLLFVMDTLSTRTMSIYTGVLASDDCPGLGVLCLIQDTIKSLPLSREQN